jgi:hypothetical protein
MNKPSLIIMANDKARVDDEEGGVGLEFDPNSILSNTKENDKEIITDNIVEPPVEDVLMSKTLWPE